MCQYCVYTIEAVPSVCQPSITTPDQIEIHAYCW